MNLKIYTQNVVTQHVYKDFVTKVTKGKSSMGLAASQARLLTITARKSDCEFQSMRYSHQKIALSRDLANLSNEYQNSLDKTKLVYDFYGTGDETTALNYGLMMTPSEMNGYLPILATDASGKAVLSSQYAAAARAAGIPQEGLGCLPSSDVRNRFLQGMVDSGLITQAAADTYMGIQYAQTMGVGTTDLVTTEVQQMTLEQLLDYYDENTDLTATPGTFSKEEWKTILNEDNNRVRGIQLRSGNLGEDAGTVDSATFTLSDILKGNYRLVTSLNYKKTDGRNGAIESVANNIANLDIWEWMFNEFESLLSVAGNSGIERAFQTAKAKTQALLSADNLALWAGGDTKEDGQNGFHGVMDTLDGVNSGYSGSWWQNGLHRYEAVYSNTDYIGICVQKNSLPNANKWHRADGVAINITNIAKAFLTYFAIEMEGVGHSKYEVSEKNSDNGSRTVKDSNLIDLDDDFLFDVVVNTGVNTDQALISGFYDSIFNQICLRGWTENNQVLDNDYLQEMLKTGKLFLTTCADDGYYYQGNYATNTYVREITDDEAIAKAEAKYNTEKQKLNQKEEILDLKMKNLDTEISSLTTEYDTIKSVISKNIEKSFKRYDA